VPTRAGNGAGVPRREGVRGRRRQAPPSCRFGQRARPPAPARRPLIGRAPVIDSRPAGRALCDGGAWRQLAAAGGGGGGAAMLLTVFCLRRDRSELTFSLQVDADFELQNFRALCELESGIPAAESQVGPCPPAGPAERRGRAGVPGAASGPVPSRRVRVPSAAPGGGHRGGGGPRFWGESRPFAFRILLLLPSGEGSGSAVTRRLNGVPPGKARSSPAVGLERRLGRKKTRVFVEFSEEFGVLTRKESERGR